jgi:uncharacterized protein YggE
MSRQYLAFTIIIIAVVLLFVSFIVWSQRPSHQSMITISASGTVTANPTQSSLYLFLNGTGNTSASAVANLSVVTGRLNSTLEPYLNGNSSLIQTQSYNVYPTNNCTRIYPGPVYPVVYPTTTIYCNSTRTFYVASESVTVTIPNIGSTDAAITGLSEIKGIYISEVSAKLSAQQQTNMSQRALTLALSNATAQAQALAGGKGVSIVNITVQNTYFYPLGVFSAAAVAASNQTFFAGTASVTKNVYVVFSTQ